VANIKIPSRNGGVFTGKYTMENHGKSTVSMDDVPLSGRFSPQRRGDMARSVNRHDLQRALEEAEDSMKMGKPWETVWLDGETMGKHGVSPSG
jgi:hypothetical protein